MTKSHADRPKPWERGAGRLAHNIFGLRIPGVAELPGIAAFSSPGVSRVVLPLLAAPEISPDLACQVPRSFRVRVVIRDVEVNDCTEKFLGDRVPPEAWDLTEQVLGDLPTPEAENLTERHLGGLFPPEIVDLDEPFLFGLASGLDPVSLFRPIQFPEARGKSYGERAEDDALESSAVVSITHSEKDITEECIHGLKRAWCEFCSEVHSQPKASRTKTVEHSTHSTIDLFDLIRPLLQPPLGDRLDNVVSFPVGKKLYPFQGAGVCFLVEHPVALLGDEMGLGKSIQAITALRILIRAGKVRNVLLLCPKSVVYDWYYKFWEWAPELQVLMVRASPQERAVLWESPAHVYLTTYDTLRNDVNSVNPHRFDLCLLDEIQYIKNPGAGITQAVRTISAKIRWGLTGTPLENKLEDVISIFAYLKPGLLQMTDADNPLRVRMAIQPFMLRRRAGDVLDDLPEKVSHEVWLELGPRQRKAYDEAYSAGRANLSRNRTVPHVLALISELKQICNLDPVSGESTKLDYLQEQLLELQEEDEKALIFSQYPQKTLKQIEPRLQEFKPQLFHGQLSDRERDRIIREFQEQDTSRILLMSVKAGGVGLTLTRANHVFHFDLWWNPAVARQAEGRAHRIGQQRTVFVETLYAVGTIEQRIHALFAKKEALFQFVIDDLSDTSLTQLLTQEELFELFDLKPERKTEGISPSDQATALLRRLNYAEFEDLIARLYRAMGFVTRKTKASHDQGIDIFARRQTDAGVESILIQCKHYLDGTVSVSMLRELYGALRSRPDTGRAVLVTSGRFSRECDEFARNKSIDLVPLEQLVGLLIKYDLLEEPDKT